MNEAYKNLFKIRCEGERDLSWWRLEKFHELSSDGVISIQEVSQQNETETIDHLFSSEEACLVNKKFLKYGSCY